MAVFTGRSSSGKNRYYNAAAYVVTPTSCLNFQKVMLDYDLANIYGVEKRVLNQAVKRNQGRLESKYDSQFSLVFQTIKELIRQKNESITPIEFQERTKIGMKIRDA